MVHNFKSVKSSTVYTDVRVRLADLVIAEGILINPSVNPKIDHALVLNGLNNSHGLFEVIEILASINTEIDKSLFKLASV